MCQHRQIARHRQLPDSALNLAPGGCRQKLGQHVPAARQCQKLSFPEHLDHAFEVLDFLPPVEFKIGHRLPDTSRQLLHKLLYLLRFCPPVIRCIVWGGYHLPDALLIRSPKHPVTECHFLCPIIYPREHVRMDIHHTQFYLVRSSLRFARHCTSLLSQSFFCLNTREIDSLHHRFLLSTYFVLF